MLNFDGCPWIYLSDIQKINVLQRRIIIYSIIYYELDSNIISDKEFDSIARQLVKLQKQNKDDLKRSEYFYCMKDFDGSTGFDLYGKLKQHDKVYLTHLAKYILSLYKQQKG